MRAAGCGRMHAAPCQPGGFYAHALLASHAHAARVRALAFCAAPRALLFFFLRGADAVPTGEEEAVHASVALTLAKQMDVMRALAEYKGCQDLARKAMQSPTP